MNEWNKEQDRISDIIKEVSEQKKIIRDNASQSKEDVASIRKNFFEDVTVNFDEIDDAVETYVSIKQQTELLSERERSHGQYAKELKTLERLENSPYFGRIDFVGDGETNKDRVYIGISSFMDKEKENFLIYDWRAPIASLYYDHSPGNAEYETPEGMISGEMTLKRQYQIERGILKSMFDTGITIGDELLQSVLGKQANTKMKSIVATIQKEQNQIIRHEKTPFVVVQGAAGSGKTSAALQRVAFLLYQYRGLIQADQILLFSPNAMFSSYVASVLPELGEETMEQTTFQDYLHYRLKSSFEVETPFAQLEKRLAKKQSKGYQDMIRWKGTLVFKNAVDKHVTHLEKEGMRFRSIVFRGSTIIPASKIKSYYQSLNRSMSIPNRMEKVKEWLLQEIKVQAKKETQKKWVEEEIQWVSKEDMHKVYQKIQKENTKEDTFDDFEREQKALAQIVVKRAFAPLIKKIQKLKFIHLPQLYIHFLQNFQQWTSEKLPAGWDEQVEITLSRLKQKEMPYEDAIPYLYLQDRIEGRKSNTKIRYVLIDEAQDYTDFQFAFIKQLFPYARMTILGDLNQAIFSNEGTRESLLSYDIVPKDRQQTYRLLQSYRSTREIVEFTKSFIPGGEEIQPFNREGKLPVVWEGGGSKESFSRWFKGRLKDFRQSHDTVAVICKTAAECREAYEQLQELDNVQLLVDEKKGYEKGITILPVYLAKGIEFDAVLLYNGSADVYGKEDGRLFYTACTRAMHELEIVIKDERNTFINKAPKETYEVRNC
ncbi:RNA polymerase recycling motor HelD [Bacillaceae bacterium S4-13-58]